MTPEEKIQKLQEDMDSMRKSFEKTISSAISTIEDLKKQVYRNQFSNLFVFDEEVQFKAKLIFPVDTTVINTATVNSTGRIAIKDALGVVRYIPYF
jgi:hypothetical protein